MGRREEESGRRAGRKAEKEGVSFFFFFFNPECHFIDLSESFPCSQSFRGVSLPSCRYKGLNPAGPAVIELKLLWHTVWARRRRCAEVSASALKAWVAHGGRGGAGGGGVLV